MKVGEDLDAFMHEIRARFSGNTDATVEDLTAAMAGFDFDVGVDALAQLRAAMPAHHRMFDQTRLLAIARRISVERQKPIDTGEPKRERARGIPFDPKMPRPDRRDLEQRKYDEKIRLSLEWVNDLDPLERERLLEEALLKWTDGDERAMYRSWGIKSHLVRFEMIHVSERKDRPSTAQRELPGPKSMTLDDAIVLLESFSGMKLSMPITSETLSRVESICTRKCHPDAGGSESDWLSFRQALALVRDRKSEAA